MPVTNLTKHRTNTELRDQSVYNQVFEAILSQQLSPGMRLSEEKLGSIFAVSRTVVRTALQRLAHEGVVELRPHRGAVVASIGKQDAHELLEARRIIECAIASRAATRITRKQVARLQKLHKEELRAYKNQERGTGLRLSNDFHFALAIIAGNKALEAFARNSISRVSLITAQYERSQPPHCSYHEHLDLIESLSRHDAKRAERLMRNHIDHIERNIDFDHYDNETDLSEVFAQA